MLNVLPRSLVRLSTIPRVALSLKPIKHPQQPISFPLIRAMASKKESADKRKSPPTSGNSQSNGNKRTKTANGSNGHTSNRSSNGRSYHPNAKDTESNGIVLRKFYPPEMANSRCAEYNSDSLPRPIELLEKALGDTQSERSNIDVGMAVVHWFKRDLRTEDNRALHLASEKAKEKGVPLIALYIISPEDYEAHLTSPVRIDFELRTLEVLKKDLASLDIPLCVEVVEDRKKLSQKMIDLMKEWRAKHLFANLEYEVDELRREAKLVRTCLDEGIAAEFVHDTCVVPPGELSSGSGKQYAVYTPWYRAWMAHIGDQEELLDLFEAPSKNPTSARTDFKHIFESKIPSAPNSKSLSTEEKKRFQKLWPAGQHEAHKRLEKFVKEKIRTYDERRNVPAEDGTAVISVHFSSGTLSARTAIRKARDLNKGRLGSGDSGIMTWMSEVAWRDFYKHVLVHWPFVCMNKPFKPEYSNIEWEYNNEHFEAWCKGKTGYPIVDAAMRQLNHMGYMHNRCRMIVASFLAKDLLLDWRMGERYFMEHLVDGDFASNNGGWGFSASTGVDPQPYFRIFNPLLQSEKFDADGDYIRKWVPELEGIEGKAIHDPYDRGEGDAARKAGYPEHIIDHKFARDRALERYKAGLERSTS